MKNQPIISMSSNIGSVSITLHTSAYMYQPVVNELIKHCGQGTTCILTQTNEEAVIMVALLRKHKIKSKLIQAMEGFRFWNMAEVRFFLKCIEAGKKAGIDHPTPDPKINTGARSVRRCISCNVSFPW